MAQSVTTYLANMRTLRVVNSATGTPKQLNVGNYGNATFRKAYIYGQKSSQTNNSGTIYLGGPQDNANGQPFVSIAAGATLVLEAPVGQHYDWGMFWLDVASAGDGIIALYS